MEFLEKTLEDIIFETPPDLLKERGLNVDSKRKRQVRIGNYGIADLVTLRTYVDYNGVPGFERTVVITVYELKKEKVDLAAFTQAVRYCKGILRYLRHRKLFWNLEFEIVLVGKSTCMSEFIYLTDILHNLWVYEYNYKYDGIKFEEKKGFSLIEEGFRNG